MSEPERAIPVEQLLDAVISVPGVRDARIHTTSGGDRTLQLDLIEGVNELVVAERVAQVLDERVGFAMDQAHGLSSYQQERATDEEPRSYAGGARRRIRLDRVSVVTQGVQCEVEVTLVTEGSTVAGSASGPAGERVSLGSVVVATLRAVEKLLDGRGRASADYADVIDIGMDQVAIVLVTLALPGGSDRLPGSALVRGDVRQAAARATLAALNRRLDALLSQAAGTLPAADANKQPPANPVPVEPRPPSERTDYVTESLSGYAAEVARNMPTDPAAERYLTPAIDRPSIARVYPNVEPLGLPSGKHAADARRDHYWRPRELTSGLPDESAEARRANATEVEWEF